MNVGLPVRGVYLSLMLLLGACATAPSEEDESLGSASFGIEADFELPLDTLETSSGVAYKNNDGELITCISNCDKGHSSQRWCDWFCDCTVNDGKDRMTCESENPYIDLHETPPPEPFKQLTPGNDRLR
jgi:hypothetical protein